MKYIPIFIQITKASNENLWYKKKVRNVYEVKEDDDNPTMYFLTPKALKGMKKAQHLNIGILKEDCEVVDDGTREPFTIVTQKYAESEIDKTFREVDGWIKNYERRYGKIKE
jgi:hypothetical protein